jgi:hypothetical protein
MLYLKSTSGVRDIFLGPRVVFDLRHGVRYMLYLKSASGVRDIFLSPRVVFDVRGGVPDIFLVVYVGSGAGYLNELVLKIFIFYTVI